MIHADAMGDEAAANRFARVARITARFNHPNIVTIHSVGTHDGSPYVALEYLAGRNLRERLKTERLGFREALRTGLAIAEALKEAHRNGVLHRDLKPENVLLPRDGRLRVVDFGLARHLSSEEVGADVTQTLEQMSLQTTLVHDDAAADSEDSDSSSSSNSNRKVAQGLRGTPAYMAPEQWLERPGTPATDIWALGVVLYEMFVGRRPLEGAGVFMLCIEVGKPDPLPSIAEAQDMATPLPARLVDLVDCCLDKDPNRRPSADDVVEELTTLLRGARAHQRAEENPFRGLLPFGERHTEHFHGREAECGAFLERLRDEPLVAVVGPSGAGKSSFVGAGIIPRLREQGAWHVLRLRPGRQPFRSLASRLLTGEASSVMESAAWLLRSRLRSKVLKAVDTENPAEPSADDQHDGSEDLSTPEEQEQALAEELLEQPERLALWLTRVAQEHGGRLLLFVDQLEEIFTLEHPAPVRQAFLHAICSAADDPEGAVRVVLTLREDYLGRMAQGPWARQALSQVAVLGPPGPESLAEIVERTVEVTGYRFEDPELVREMVEALQDEPAALPLLQFAGRMLWERRDRTHQVLTREAYEKFGGVGGALARHADETFTAMVPETEQAARTIFLRLVTPEGTRRVVPQSELQEGLGTAGRQALESLTRARAVLVRKGREEPELEIVHESLINTWGKLRGWLEESQQDRVFLAEAEQAARLWERRGRSDLEVWTGPALRDALTKAARCSDLPPDVSRFLEAGRRRERGRRRWKRVLLATGVGGLLLLVVVSLAVSWALRTRERRAQQHRREAQVQRRIAEGKRAEALREGGRAAFMRGALLEARAKLRGALELRDSSMARALWWRLAEHPLRWTRRLPGNVYAVAFAPDGSRVAAACQDHTIYLLDKRTRSVRLLRGHRDQVMTLAFDSAGRSLASGSLDGKIRLWNLSSGEARELTGHKGGVWSLAFSSDRRTLASGSADRSVILWDTTTSRLRRKLAGHGGVVYAVGFTPQDRRVASGDGGGEIRLWNPTTGQVARRWQAHRRPIRCLAIQPAGQWLLSGSADGMLRTWRLSDGKAGAERLAHPGGTYGCGIGPRGRMVATGGRDHAVRLWNLPELRPRGRLEGHGATVVSVAFSASGKTLVTGSYDDTAKLWRIPGARRAIHRDQGHQGGVQDVAFSPDGRRVASASLDRSVRTWNVKTGLPATVKVRHEAGVYAVAYSPDGALIASGGADRIIGLWDAATGRAAGRLRGHRAPVLALDFHPQGELLASAGIDKDVRLWSTSRRAAVKVLPGHTRGVYRLDFSPDGKLLASAGKDKTVRLWDVKSRTPRKVLGHHAARITALGFHPDNKRLATGGWHGKVWLWDVQTGLRTPFPRRGKHPGRVHGAVFSPDGGRLGTPYSDGSARIWNLGDGHHIALKGHHAEVNALRFSPNGQQVVTASDDGTVRLWDARTGWPLWRAPLLRARPAALLTHRGWRALQTGTVQSIDRTSWQRAVLARGRYAELAPKGGPLCMITRSGKLEIWDLGKDHMSSRQSLPELSHVLAAPDGCLTIAAGVVRRHDRTGLARILARGGRAMALQDARILVATTDRLITFDASGKELLSRPVDEGITAVGQVRISAGRLRGRWLVLGFANGSLELSAPRPTGPRSPFTFEDVTASAVVRLRAGPMDTLVASFANGLIGLWSLRDGSRLAHGWLHGAVVHLLVSGNKLHAASELGTHLTWDLSVFFEPYCRLLDRVWRDVPVGWDQGLPVVTPPLASHACRAQRGQNAR